MQAEGMRTLQVLDVAKNDLLSPSLVALAGALEAGRLPKLGELYLNEGRFSDVQGSPSACSRPHMPKCAARARHQRLLCLPGGAPSAGLQHDAGTARVFYREPSERHGRHD